MLGGTKLPLFGLRYVSAVRVGVALALASVVALLPWATAPARANDHIARLLATAEVDPAVISLVSPPAREPRARSAAPDIELANAVSSFASDLGATVGSGPELLATISSAGLAADLAHHMAGALAALHACHRMSAAFAPRVLQSGPAAVTAADAAALRSCALDVEVAAEGLVAVLRAQSVTGANLDLWPVVRLSTGAVSDTYSHDYALLVDTGGDDLYLNNAGGNMVDLRRGPAYSLEPGPARGCQQVWPDASSGGVREGPDGRRQPAERPMPECVISAALLLDLAGNDTYGVQERPAYPDSTCTRDLVVRRISTAGAGVAGVGILYDEAGNDRYTGKTGTQGAGHLGGVGVLRDRGEGNDVYRAIRTAQGMGLAGGAGILVDDGGDDIYDYYMPRPLDPTAPSQTDGAGGVVDDTGLGSEAGLGQHRDREGRLDGQPGGVCDNIARSLQGAGLLGGIGVFVDHGGNDVVRAASPTIQDFIEPLDLASVRLAHGSQGSGFLGGLGAFLDGAGCDRYLDERRAPSGTRRDGQTVTPRVVPGDDMRSGSVVDASLFIDTGGCARPAPSESNR